MTELTSQLAVSSIPEGDHEDDDESQQLDNEIDREEIDMNVEETVNDDGGNIFDILSTTGS